MSEDEYMSGEPMDDDEGEILYEYLIEEPSDLTLVMLPKIEFDLESELESYYKQLKICKRKDDIKYVLRKFYSHISSLTRLQDDIQFLQDRAKELEISVQLMQQQYR